MLTFPFDLTLNFSVTNMLDESGENAGLNEEIACGAQNLQKFALRKVLLTQPSFSEACHVFI